MNKKLLIATLAGATSLVAVAAFTTSNVRLDVKGEVTTQTITFDCNSTIKNSYLVEETAGHNKVAIASNLAYFTSGVGDGYIYKKTASNNNVFVYTSTDSPYYDFENIVSFSVNYDNLTPDFVSDGNQWVKIELFEERYNEMYLSKMRDFASATTYHPSDCTDYDAEKTYRGITVSTYGAFTFNLISITVTFTCGL